MLLVNAVDRERRVTVERARQLMQKGEGAARALLERLVEGGVLEGRGEGRNRVYHFAAATYRAIGPASAYTRASGFEVIQQEQMILSHLRAHGRITRRDVMDLCQAPEDRARYLLRRLVADHQILSQGSGRGTFYKLSA
jgi:ATP-dependent DNA helicase RecG